MISYRTQSIANPHIHHYWHFMAGYFIPILLQEDQGKEIYVKNCGDPMNRHWKNIVDRKIKIGFPKEHDPIMLDNYDRPNCGSLKRKDIEKFLEVYWRNVGMPKRSRKKVYTLIDRGTAQLHYDHIGRKTAGGRRSIVDIDDFEKELCEYKPFKRHYLEKLNLKEQSELFFKSDVIVLQHGAAMFNTIFCRPNTIVIELAKDCWRYYGKWSSLCKINRTALPEPFNQKPSAENVIKAIKQSSAGGLTLIDL